MANRWGKKGKSGRLNFLTVQEHYIWKASIFQCSVFFMLQLSHPHITTQKTITLTRQIFVGKVMSLLCNMLSCCCWVTSVVSDSVWPHKWQPTSLPCPWDSPGKNTGVGCHFLLQCMKVKSESEVAQSCPTFHDPMDCSPPGSSIHGIFQARVLEWGAIAFSEYAV